MGTLNLTLGHHNQLLEGPLSYLSGINEFVFAQNGLPLSNPGGQNHLEELVLGENSQAPMEN